MSASSERRVLLVEDDDMHAELIKRAFEDEPAIILTVANRLDEALTALQEGMPDMVIADLRLPDGRGIDLCQGQDYPIVIMTSQGSETDAVEAMRAGALDYIVKSDVMFSEMPHVVDRALRQWHLTKAHARADQQLRAQYEIASALATSATLAEAAERILESIGRSVGWPVGELWRVDEATQHLRREASWVLEPSYERVVTEGGGVAFASGEGFPGRLWARGEPGSEGFAPGDGPSWSRSLLSELSLRFAYGFPVVSAEGHTLAVFAFYAPTIEKTNGDIARLAGTVSAQINIFAERQRAEEERQRLRRELFERERLAAVGETAATLAHEIGNPLNSMYMHTQLLKRRLAHAPELDPKIGEGVELLMTENKRLAKLLNDFRAMARRDDLRRGPVGLVDLLDGLLALQLPLADSNEVELVRRIPAELPSVRGDEDRLKQVFLNILKNAIEAMPHGGCLTVEARLDGERVLIEVTDTGEGVPEGMDVFEPFRTTKQTGTGLGLPVARRVVEAHGGTIECESTPGEGTSFRVVLPLDGGE